MSPATCKRLKRAVKMPLLILSGPLGLVLGSLATWGVAKLIHPAIRGILSPVAIRQGAVVTLSIAVSFAIVEIGSRVIVESRKRRKVQGPYEADQTGGINAVPAQTTEAL